MYIHLYNNTFLCLSKFHSFYQFKILYALHCTYVYSEIIFSTFLLEETGIFKRRGEEREEEGGGGRGGRKEEIEIFKREGNNN